MTIPMFRILAALMVAIPCAAGAATFTVTRGDDPVPDECAVDDCSLREAIAATAATPEADTIVLGAGQYQVTIGPLGIQSAMTIRGAGSSATRVVASGGDSLIYVGAFGNLTIEHLEAGSIDGDAIVVFDNAFATLRDIKVAGNAGGVGTASDDNGTGAIRIEQSTIDSGVACLQALGSCRMFDSRVHRIIAQDAEIELQRVEVDGAGEPLVGIEVGGGKPITIVDSTIRNADLPLRLVGNGETADPVHIRRTRFLDNTGPLLADRIGAIFLDDVEFRHHVISDDMLSLPAVLLAEAGPIWYFSNALVVGNRGGSTIDGAVFRILAGGRVFVDNSTFDDNTFRPDVGSSYGHTIGVYNNTSTPTLLFLVHVTMRRSLLLTDDTVGSLLTVRGPSTDVRVFNSVLHGTCGFGGGGTITAAMGNAESPGHGCNFDEADNFVDILPSNLFLGSLGDHGGFTETFLPARSSMLIDAANSGACQVFGTLDQRRYLRSTDGSDCDIGSVEVNALSDAIFADAFEGA